MFCVKFINNFLKEMKTKIYESPAIAVVEMELEGAILSDSTVVTTEAQNNDVANVSFGN